VRIGTVELEASLLWCRCCGGVVEKLELTLWF
jgi:hypothetical protein